MMNLAQAQDFVTAGMRSAWKIDYYESLYRKYELDYLPHLIEMIEPLPRRSVLDIGPGWGTMMVLLADRGWDVTVLDCEPLGAYITEELFAGLGAKYITADVFDAPPPGKFSLILCTQVLLHLKYRPDHALRNIARMLDPDGLAIFTALKPECYPALKSAFGPEWRKMPEYGTARAVSETVTCLLPPDALLDLLHTAFQRVELLSPANSTVMFARCEKPTDV